MPQHLRPDPSDPGIPQARLLTALLLCGSLLCLPAAWSRPPALSTSTSTSTGTGTGTGDLSGQGTAQGDSHGDGWLFAALEAGDRSLLPRVRPAPGGRVTIEYRRFGDQGPLDAAQLLALMRQPPRHAQQRAAIRTLLQQLRALGVRLEWGPMPQPQAAALWDPQRALLRLRSDLPASGSEELARVLNHEVIHVAQSCSAGGIRRPPQPLGLGLRPDPLDRPLLDRPPYRHISALQRRVEEEAFGGQWDLSLGPRLLSLQCGAPQPPARLGS